MERLLKALKIAFASEFSFYLKAHNFHWNVEGPDFKQYHDLFGGIYEEVYSSIDPFAEQIRAAGGYAPGSLQRFSMLTQIEDEAKVPMALDMVVELMEDSDKMAEIFRMCFQLSEQEGLHGLSDFLAGRQDAHKKHSWMLRATSK
jgi:starvation-inducible DNA-binding protein